MHRTHWVNTVQTTGTADLTLQAAGGADVFHYLTALTISNTDASNATEIIIGPGTVEGATTAGTGANNAGVGTVAWTTPENITASDDSDATITDGGAGSTSNYLFATNFGFTIPTNATINGIVAEWEKQETSTSTIDNEIRILKAGAVVGDDKSVGAAWAATDTFASYGGETDLWGTTWTPAEVNATGFGTALSATLAAADTANVDSARMTVYFSLGRIYVPVSSGRTHNFDTTPIPFGNNNPVAVRSNVAATTITVTATGYTVDIS